MKRYQVILAAIAIIALGSIAVTNALNTSKLESRIQELENHRQVYKQQQKNCIKEALWHEARNQGTDGIIAVMSVIENRKNHPNYPSTYCEVIWQPQQFSYKQKGSGASLDYSVKESEKPVLMVIDSIAQDAVDGNFKPVLHNSVLWYTTTTVKNYWTKTKKKVLKLKQHVFYSDKKKVLDKQ